MPTWFAGNTPLIMTVLVFVTVLLLVTGLYQLWKTNKGPQARNIERRLRSLSAASDDDVQARLIKDRMLSEVPLFQGLLMRLPRAHGLDRVILQAGLDWTVSNLLLACAVLGAMGMLGAVLLVQAGLLLALMVGALLAALPLLYVQHKRKRRLTRLEHQLPEALDLITRALRAGHAFPAGLQMAGEELQEPIGNEFRTVADEVNFGISLQQALTNLSVRVPITDLRYFVVAVLIQRDSGGNLTELLQNLSRLIRERLKLLSKVRVLTAEGRMSAWVLVLLPFALAALMNLLNPEFMSPMWTDPLGIKITQYMLGLMAVGVLVVRKLVRLRV